MSDENPLLSQRQSNEIIGPVLCGAMAQLILFGFIISHLINLRSTNTWIKSSNGTRAICWAVMLLNMAFTGMATEPLILGLIAIAVQLTLGWRSSRIIQRPTVRWIYFAFVGTIAILSFLACIGVTVSSIGFHRGNYDNWCGISFSSYLGLWMWGECLTDLVITVTYLILLYRRLSGQNETVDSVWRLIGLLTVRSAAYTTIFAMLAAIFAQVFPDLPYYDILYSFCTPLASLYTIPLFITLTIGETVQKTLGNHVSDFQVSQTSTGHLSSGAAPIGVTRSIPATRPISVRVDSDYGQPPDEGKAFEWARGRDNSL